MHRNRAKRILKALLILVLEDLKPGDYVFVAKPALLATPFAQLQKNFLATLKKGDLL